jgi:hypothetical protein
MFNAYCTGEGMLVNLFDSHSTNLVLSQKRMVDGVCRTKTLQTPER